VDVSIAKARWTKSGAGVGWINAASVAQVWNKLEKASLVRVGGDPRVGRL
jgi:hypothetical protein